MTKVPVNVPNFAANMMYGTPKVQSTDAAGEFSKIFESQKSTVSEKPQEVGCEKDTLESQKEPVKDVTGQAGDTQSTSSVKETKETQSGQNTEGDAGRADEGELSEEEMNLIMPLLQNAVGDIRDLLAQELGISSDELKVLMEDMGLSDMDLLNSDTLKDVLLQAKGLDMTALLTNEELYGQIQSLESSFEEVMSNVQETLQMDDDEMSMLKEQLANMDKEPVSLIELMEKEAEGNLKASEKQAGGEEQNLQNNAFATPNQNLFNARDAVNQHSSAQTTSTGFSGAETQNIMNQILDYMRIQLNEETSTLEMQLQPESLGTLQIRISAKEGIMTAQFTTASETVKAALEGQMVQLQQQFENQNIKVEAIEVTVQTHQFESALQQGEEKQQQAEDSKKNRVRKIDLNQLENAEEIPEEDRLVAEMMAANGTTVDYLA